MSDRKLIAVFGARGHQGNSVARALLQKGYQVRALTRYTDSPKAKALQAAGASTQTVDLDDPSSIESAVQGAHGVFGVTNFWGLLAENPETAFEREIKQGKAIGDACKKLGVKHLVYSGLPAAEPIIGKKCPHLDAKAIVERYLEDNGVTFTAAHYGPYNENILTFFSPQKQEDGTYAITLPITGPFLTIAVEDGGPAVAAIFDDPSEYIGKKITLYAEKITMEKVVTILSEVTGKTIKYNQVPNSVFAKFPFPGADELAIMFEFFASGSWDPSLEPARKLNPNMMTFETWAEKNKDAIAALL